MSEPLVRAELIKLSRVLGTGEGQVAFLAPLGVAGLRQLEDRVSSALFDEHRKAFQGLADAAKLLPASLVAKMSELVFGPMLSARVAGLMDPAKAIEVASKLKTRFLADVCVEMDPRSASELLKRMPTKIIIDVAQLLLERHEYVTMGRFVDDLTDEAIRAVTAAIKDDEALVRIGFFVERAGRLNDVVGLLDDERVRRIVATTSSGPPDVQAAGLGMMSQFSPAQLARFGEAAISLGPKVLNALIATAQREDAADVVGAVMQGVGASGRKAFAAMLKGMDAATLAAWARATTEAGLWPAALRILAASSRDIQREAAEALGRLDPAARAPIGAAVRKEKLLDALEPLRPLL